MAASRASGPALALQFGVMVRAGVASMDVLFGDGCLLSTLAHDPARACWIVCFIPDVAPARLTDVIA